MLYGRKSKERRRTEGRKKKKVDTGNPSQSLGLFLCAIERWIGRVEIERDQRERWKETDREGSSGNMDLERCTWLSLARAEIGSPAISSSFLFLLSSPDYSFLQPF